METLEAKIKALMLLRMEDDLKELPSDEIARILDDKMDQVAHTIVDQLEEIWGL